MLPLFMLEIRYYVASGGHQPFAEWFADLDPLARAKVVRSIAMMAQGNLSNVKAVGEGVLEYRIDFGPGYRVYFGRDGERAARRSDSSATSRRRLLIGATIRKASAACAER